MTTEQQEEKARAAWQKNHDIELLATARAVLSGEEVYEDAEWWNKWAKGIVRRFGTKKEIEALSL